MIGAFFNLILIDPLTNLFVLLTTFTGNAGVAIILLTILIRVATLPLTLRQMHSMRMMAVIGPKSQELQKKYSDPKRRNEEQMKLYKEAGINPLGCLSGAVLQFPILIALYRTFTYSLGQTPEALIKLSSRLYPWDYLRSGMPLNAHFLWLNLGLPDPLTIPMPMLVGISTYVYQKLTVLPTTDEKQRAQNSMMNFMMPLIFGYITLNLPSGLGLYYVLTNVIGMVMQYVYIGGGPFNWRALLGLNNDPVLPKALEVRNEAMRRIGNDDDESTAVARKPAPLLPAPTTNGKRPDEAASQRRKRYTSGRRRSRR